MAEQTKLQRTLTGKVVSSRMNKTISVAVVRSVPHDVYGKYVRRTSKIMAHDENNDCREGDTVVIAECRPISRHKSWRLLEIVARAERTADAATSV